MNLGLKLPIFAGSIVGLSYGSIFLVMFGYAAEVFLVSIVEVCGFVGYRIRKK